MTETLVIRLRASEDAPASWLIVDANGARSGNVQSGPIADALALALCHLWRSPMQNKLAAAAAQARLSR